MSVWFAALNGGRPSGICGPNALPLIRLKSVLVAELPAVTRAGTRFAKEFPTVRFMNAEIPPGLWQPVTQLAVRIGWICAENETVAAGAAVMLSESAMVAVAAGAAESVTRTVTFEIPGVAGVPLINPAALRVNPAGRVPAAITHV
jgi:hypothetical protein